MGNKKTQKKAPKLSRHERQIANNFGIHEKPNGQGVPDGMPWLAESDEASSNFVRRAGTVRAFQWDGGAENALKVLAFLNENSDGEAVLITAISETPTLVVSGGPHDGSRIAAGSWLLAHTLPVHVELLSDAAFADRFIPSFVSEATS